MALGGSLTSSAEADSFTESADLYTLRKGANTLVAMLLGSFHHSYPWLSDYDGMAGKAVSHSAPHETLPRLGHF